MVDILPEYPARATPAQGTRCRHGRLVSCYFNEELFLAIQKEAVARGWPLGRMIRHLCEASIEGVE